MKSELLTKNSSTDTIIEKCNEFIAKDKYKQAIEYYLKALDTYPKNIDILYNLSNLYFSSEYPDKAVKILEQILKINPKIDKAQYLLAKTYYIYLNEYNKSLKHVFRAIELNPNNSYYYSLAAEINYSANFIDKSQELAQKALSLNENNYEAHLVLATYYYNNNELDLANKHYEIALLEESKQDESGVITSFHIQIAKIKDGYKLIKKYKNHSNKYKWLYKFSFMHNNILNLPIITLENIKLTKKSALILSVAIIATIAFMYTSQNNTIMVVDIFKWICSILFIIFIPYQLLIYLVLNIYYYLIEAN